MARRKWTKKEIEQWRREHGGVGYFNKEDSNLLVPRSYGFGLSLNWANPWAYVMIAAVIAVIVVMRIVRKAG